MLIRLTRKLAERVDGIDLSRSREGDVLDLSRHDAHLLVAEGWAVSYEPPAPPAPPQPQAAAGAPPPEPTESAAPSTIDHVGRVRAQIERRYLEQQEERRIEDRIREELHDARARIVGPTSQDEPA